ncbi:ATP-binding cassette domain-containing protein [Rhodobacterales bacterium HKCCE2091]|nr:ATP-binding cassette domain-containing protein [Rhodobacterales bacterium HKCCE2091]
MRAVLRVLGLLLRADPWAMARGAAMAVAVLAMGAALLGLSGWFITATGLGGLAGIGIAFDVFRPSAGVRFLALGRTAARYGERLLTHDATLRALAALRVALFRGQAGRDGRVLLRLRGGGALTRIVSDVDALDGLVLRLLLPFAAGGVTHALAFVALGWIVGWPVAVSVAAGYLPAAALILMRLAWRAARPSARAEDRAQALRRGLIDTIRDREALILAGGLREAETRLGALDAEARAAAADLDRAERDAAAALSALTVLVAAAALVAGGWLLSTGAVDPARAAIGVFVALAMAETILPLRRGVAEIGRMAGAAGRIAPGLPPAAETVAAKPAPAPVADAPILSIRRAGLSFDLSAGEAAALTGPSGAGKSSLLLSIAGLAPSDGIGILGHAPSRWPDPDLRRLVTLVPQRSALLAGTIRDNLALSCTARDADMTAALDAVDLSRALHGRGGLDATLGEGGAGLSGGQAKRLALARALLRSPDLLLLDEPTEGLDGDTADRVLAGIRGFLPDAAILAALHRNADHPIFATKHRVAVPGAW